MVTRVVVSLFLGITMVSCYSNSNNNDAETQSTSNIPAAEAVKAKYGSLPLSERLSGTVIAQNQVALYPEIAGKVSKVYVQNGDSVKKGAPISSLDNSQYREQVKQAKATLRINRARLKQANARYKELEAKFKRTKQLSEQDLSSDLEMETLQAQMSSAEADVELSEAQLEQAQSSLQEQKEILARTTIRAPIAGRVGQRNAEVGMQVNTGTQLFMIGDLNNLRVEVTLTDEMLEKVKVGQKVRIYAGANDMGGQVINAQLSRISLFLNDVTRSTEGEIDVKNGSHALRPGMFVPVDILYAESRQATLVPASAIYSNPTTGKQGVYVATSLGTEIKPVKPIDPDNLPPLTEPTDVTFKPVKIIAEGQMQTGITGIEAGAWVITVGQNLLSEGGGQARIRTSTWERMLGLQKLQRQDLLRSVLNNNFQQPDSATNM